MKSLSIIIPVYNVEKYLPRCLDSVVKQITDECEVILIDDGSTDCSLNICQDYREKYDGFTVIHQENQGLSMARNTGINAANGRYIMFLDSDDWIEEGTIEEFLRIINDYAPDLIRGKAVSVDDSDNRKLKIDYFIPQGLYKIEEYLGHLKTRMVYTPCAPFMLYNRDFVNKFQLRFKPGILHEDTLWTPLVLLCAETVYCTDLIFYCHYTRLGSITRSDNQKQSGNDLITVCYELRKAFKKNPDVKNFEALRDIIARKYLEATVKIGAPVNDNRAFSGKELLSYSFFKRTKRKVRLYSISPKLYIKIATKKKP